MLMLSYTETPLSKGSLREGLLADPVGLPEEQCVARCLARSAWRDWRSPA